MMLRRALLALPLASPAIAQTAPVRIGWLSAQRPESLAQFIPVLRAGLAERGLAEGRDIAIEYRFAQDDIAQVPALLQDLVRAQVRLVLVQGAAVQVAFRESPPVPLVFALSGDPVAAGLTESLARPRRGSTGVTFMMPELSGKRMELLRELDPALRDVAIIANPVHSGENLERDEAREMAAALGLSVAVHHARSAAELEAALAALGSRPPGAIQALSDGFVLQNIGRIAAFARERRVPLITGWRSMAQAGALMSYGPVLTESYRRLAYFVERILRGTRPEEMPIERPRNFELVVNLRTAAATGLDVPTALLARADEVLE
jgi:putative ABC transport system substrate-binding protein